jgi:hypothetical protein
MDGQGAISRQRQSEAGWMTVELYVSLRVFSGMEEMMRPVDHTDPVTISVQVLEFPAPMCGPCNVPMWVNKTIRHSTDQAITLKTDYQCPLCNAQIRLRRQKPVVMRSAAPAIVG